MKKLKQSYNISASIDKVWQALTDPEIIDEWGGGPAKMKDEVGFNFSLWGGDIWGKNIKVTPKTILKQEWYSGQWDKPSIVTFELSEKDNTTTVNLTHTDIPDAEYDDIKLGWDEYYMEPLTELLEKN